ncbi:hypothetical protein BpHYR1_046939 [Brachionus plicatilis]|uniref:Uncharacterized protein n=1 Tax=Brachionus plicatilis TaxID=10195 RepID=A0A3M7RGE3_BRAPC|nr:hypothetical protein BpHYR1_046939 [Brachionus plicatilis]
MTKSGIGTAVQHTLCQQSSAAPNLAPSIGSAEIPIWVADRKKWVTGISKKTTINDLIYAILKQCQLVSDSAHTDSSATIEQIGSQYALTEYQYEPSAESPEAEFVLSSQRVLDGDSKVYKHLSKWSQIATSNSLMLKILQREQISDGPSETPVQPSHNSLAHKLLKKIGVNSNSNLNRNVMVHSNSVSALGQVSYRLVDVKLPNGKGTCATLKPAEASADTHRTILFNTIIERENRLKKQKDKFSLLDELLRESEKKTKVVYESYNSLGNSSAGSNLVELNDIYCHFPEMCTHNINEVEDFTYKCCQLFKLDEAIQSQKQVLNNCELDLQRELNNQNQFGSILNQSMVSNECPEVVELRKEVNNSREQTRIQCKQLHDLDHKMRQSEQNLMLKEQELNQLLEQLYVQEVYTDYGQEAKTPVDPATELHEDLERINVDGDLHTAATLTKLTSTAASRSSANLCQLSAAHKSLSYANLTAPVQQTSPNMQKSQATAKLKSSPSMDMNNKNLLINTNDQLGETDSGISSMSSETAVTTTTSSSSSASSSAQIINATTSPSSLPINNLYFSGQKSVSNSQFGYQMGQQQYSFQQQQQPRQYVSQHKQALPISSQSLASCKQVKSVLETLV